MNHSTKYISVDTIISKLYRDLKGTNLQEDDLIEWIGEALDFIKVPEVLEEHVAFLKVEDYEASLPQNLQTILQVARYNGQLKKSCDKCSVLDLIAEMPSIARNEGKNGRLVLDNGDEVGIDVELIGCDDFNMMGEDKKDLKPYGDLPEPTQQLKNRVKDECDYNLYTLKDRYAKFWDCMPDSFLPYVTDEYGNRYPRIMFADSKLPYNPAAPHGSTPYCDRRYYCYKEEKGKVHEGTIPNAQKRPSYYDKNLTYNAKLISKEEFELIQKHIKERKALADRQSNEIEAVEDEYAAAMEKIKERKQNGAISEEEYIKEKKRIESEREQKIGKLKEKHRREMAALEAKQSK